MTGQAHERLIYKDQELHMATEPLAGLLRARPDISFVSPTTACWRGYYGQWKIRQKKLYLINLEAYLVGYEKVGVEHLFPGQKVVFANWFSGKIRVPQGEEVNYVHMGYESLYEEDLILTFEKGVLQSEYVVNNQNEIANLHEVRSLITYFEEQEKIKERKRSVPAYLIGITTVLLALFSLSYGILQVINSYSYLSTIAGTVLISPVTVIIYGLIAYYFDRTMRKREMVADLMAYGSITLSFFSVFIVIYHLISWRTLYSNIILGLIGISLVVAIYFALKNRI